MADTPPQSEAAMRQELQRLEREVASMRQHKNDYMEATETTRRALTSEIEFLRTQAGTLLSCMGDSLNQLVTAEDQPSGAAALQALTTFAQAPAQTSVSFQRRVRPWLLECFGEDIAYDGMERNHRFLEEALELVQACGCTEAEALKLVSYVFGRPVGERSQEVGGVMVTLAALCLAHGLDMHGAGETELARISQPETITRIRMKQASKPAMSPLPGVYPERQPQGSQHERQQ
ncbi:TPA: hypothetical protein L4R50_000096 [Pseudomonas aeruginosa]|nr:hypothetical protein [Pseudomonas aeruginosa]